MLKVDGTVVVTVGGAVVITVVKSVEMVDEVVIGAVVVAVEVFPLEVVVLITPKVVVEVVSTIVVETSLHPRMKVKAKPMKMNNQTSFLILSTSYSLRFKARSL
ncbi:MAG: hypothetical protein ACOX16_01725 [Candidatus Izemoplasmatales bacterium]